MDTLGNLLVAAVGLEAVMELLRNAWDAKVRAVWNPTRLLVVVLAVLTAVFFSDRNLVAGTGLDLGVDLLGRIVTGVAVARVVTWVHNFYKKTAG